MNIYRIGNIRDKKVLLKELGVESGGISIMSKKMELFCFYISNLRTPAVNILKQDALSIGAELAVPSGAITCDKDKFDCVLIANKRHIEILAQKELSQPFGLKNVAKELSGFLHAESYKPKIMGIINANGDSFYAGSRFVADNAITKIEKMINDGASIIDIGAVSSRPGSDPIGAELELARIKPICDSIKSNELYKKVTFSIDSYTPAVVEYALSSGFSIVNDITGASDNQIVKLAVKYNAKLCIMHMKGVPKDMQKSPQYNNVMAEVSRFFDERIEKCVTIGLEKERIILDVGIGFGKKLEHNVTLLNNIQHFKRFGCELLVGASRKSMISDIHPSAVEDRLPGTLAIHLRAVENGVGIIRCHDVKEHKQAISVLEYIN